jgi:hypothetical protein
MFRTRTALLALGMLIALFAAPLPRVVADEKEDFDKAEKNVRDEIQDAHEKIVIKKKKNAKGDYNFVKAIVCWNAARYAQIDQKYMAAMVLLNEAHEQLTIFYTRNGKKLRQDSGDKSLDRKAEKTEAKLKVKEYDDYLETLEQLAPSFADLYSAKDWTEVENAVHGAMPPEPLQK